MKISFGSKIPISETQVYNSERHKFEKATLYEYDGKDRTDVDEFASKTGDWQYKFRMAADLADKYVRLNSGEKLTGFERHALEHNKYYVLETQNDETAAICETQGCFNTFDVHYLERNLNGKYKLAGRAILASIGKSMLNEADPVLEVSDPVNHKRAFYTVTCGFKEKTPGSHGVTMDEDGIRKFVEKYEQEVKAPIMDIIC